MGFPGGSVVRNLPANAGDMGTIPRLERSLGEGNGNLRQYSYVVLEVKNPPANAGASRDEGSIPRSGRFLGSGYGNRLQYSCLENPMDRGNWQATVHGVTKSQTRPKQLSTVNF